jgi:hypothetical protein
MKKKSPLCDKKQKKGTEFNLLAIKKQRMA